MANIFNYNKNTYKSRNLFFIPLSQLTMESSNIFQQYKNLGNEQMKDFENVPQAIRDMRAEKAIQHYKKAECNAVNKKDRASVWKNCGFVALSQAKSDESSLELRVYWLIQCLKYYSKALYYGLDSMNREWLESVLKNQQAIQNLIKSCI